ncbi:NAD-dependent epimerase/dehydratase family protein [Mucilaginibacter celer]|uniref:NAD-dependent epimerase/dehydratase family protein n=1 Tax=Mucilaginibacter celer TaxID=2305508 RepID=A0A494VNW6_9SPHI|nr:NAD-dependent epimerase/dehydratase [Mucilaginibacter celer]AYL97126.1 NAD-dependent epimerase/dehydratase family protein [Mucilaginibacter celer]
MSNIKTILITGINGYLGSRMAKTLLANYKVVGLEYSLNNLFRLEGLDIKMYSVENGVPDELFTDQKIDAIIHAATFYGRLNEQIATMANANLFVPFDLLDKAIKNNCSLFINTDTVLDRFVSTYALTKRQFQEWLYMRRSEIKVINMQLEHFYGPGCSNTNFITAMIERMRNNEPQIDLTKGEQLRDFVYVDDVMSAYLTVLDKLDTIEAAYSGYQVGSDKLLYVKDVLLAIKEYTGSTSSLNFGAVPYRENELMKSEVDNSGLKALGWKPEHSFEEGLALTADSN